MYTQILAFFLAPSVLAVPLNINLGAYSPALVVGDGEISFGGTAEAGGAAKSAAMLFETLATGAQAGSQISNPQGAPATLSGTTAPAAVAPAPAPAAPAGGEANPAKVGETPAPEGQAATNEAFQNIAKKVLQPITKRSLNIRDIQGFRESLAFAKEAMKNTPDIELGTKQAGVGIKQNPGLAVPVGSAAAGTKAAKRDVEESEGRAGITLLAIAEI